MTDAPKSKVKFRRIEEAKAALRDSVAGLVQDFLKVAELAGRSLTAADIDIDAHPAPHRQPSSQPGGMQAVYIFMAGERCLKIGKAGPNSSSRYCSQHYGTRRARSSLATSLVRVGYSVRGSVAVEDSIDRWICTHTSRVNLLIPAEYGDGLLTLLEGFTQCRLKPVFEGRARDPDGARQIRADTDLSQSCA